MYNYFPHPSNLRQSSGVVSLLIEEGFAGYGIYLSILELLRDAPSFRYSADAKVLAYVLHATDIEQVGRVVRNFGLFDTDSNGLLFSPWLSEQLEAYSDKKHKLQEAGKRGAARRWAKVEDGQAIATPSVEDGQAIAIIPNLMQPNITTQNKTSPSETSGEEWRDVCRNQGEKVDDELVSAIASTQPEGHASGFVADVCRRYGIGQNVLNLLLRATNNADLGNRRYIAFAALIRRIEVEKYRPEYPANFICSKIL